jgi:hypothetical protein
MGRTGTFRPAGDWKKAAGNWFYQESASAKTENGNSLAIFFENGVPVTEGSGRPTQKSLARACITAMINGFLGQG